MILRSDKEQGPTSRRCITRKSSPDPAPRLMKANRQIHLLHGAPNPGEGWPGSAKGKLIERCDKLRR
jgi:hypothetical protein